MVVVQSSVEALPRGGASGGSATNGGVRDGGAGNDGAGNGGAGIGGVPRTQQHLEVQQQGARPPSQDTGGVRGVAAPSVVKQEMEREFGETVDVLNVVNVGGGLREQGKAASPSASGQHVREDVMQSILECLPSHMSQHHHEMALNAVCQVEGCTKRLCHLKEYHQRYRVCMEHLKCDYIVRNGVQMRFCQQCGKFQDLAQFDAGKRSCRERLKKHNERRRKRLDARYAAALMLKMSDGEKGGAGGHGQQQANSTAGGMMNTMNTMKTMNTMNTTNNGSMSSGMPSGVLPGSGNGYGYGASYQMATPGTRYPVPRPQVGSSAPYSMPGYPMPSYEPQAQSQVGALSSMQSSLEMVSELVSYMVAVRNLGTMKTDLEGDLTSQTCSNLLNMALNANLTPKIVPSPRVMELLIRNFAGALKYDVSGLTLTPLPGGGVGGGIGGGVGGGIGMMNTMGNTQGMGASYPGEQAGGGVTGGDAKRQRHLSQNESGEAETTQGLADLMNFISESRGGGGGLLGANGR